MDIKVGDIVEFEGVKQRVMGIYKDDTVSLSKQSLFTFQPLKALTLIESVQLPAVKPGDFVLIHPAPICEAWFAYPKTINHELHNINHEQPVLVEEIIEDDKFGPRVQVKIGNGSYNFHLYCVEKINDYDMV